MVVHQPCLSVFVSCLHRSLSQASFALLSLLFTRLLPFSSFFSPIFCLSFFFVSLRPNFFASSLSLSLFLCKTVTIQEWNRSFFFYFPRFSLLFSFDVCASRRYGSRLYTAALVKCSAQSAAALQRQPLEDIQNFMKELATRPSPPGLIQQP